MGETDDREPAPAKINLFLHVVGRRGDGYHLLDSLAVFAAAGDVVRAARAERWSLEIIGPHGGGLSAGEDNLVLRAARALAAAAADVWPARLVLEKNLPTASGIGGGSADAAATLRLLARLWKYSGDLSDIAASLGADVPVCLASVPARMGGVGDVLTSAPTLPGYGLVLINPGVAVSTQAVFSCRSGAFSQPARLPPAWPGFAAMADELGALRNDLEPPARALAPAIDLALASLRQIPGCHLTRMSGSGATCFGLFADGDAATAAARSLARPGWWCWGGAAMPVVGATCPHY